MKCKQATLSIGTFALMLVSYNGFSQTTPATGNQGQVPDQQYSNYESWDADANEVIDDNEFYNGIMGTERMAEWDADADGSLTDREFYDGSRTIWDANDDNMLDEDEWNNGIATYYSEYDEEAYGGFNDWDGNQDGMIDSDEYNQGIANSGFYGNWDANSDNQIDPMEYSQGVYRSYDADGSGYIESGEYERWNNSKRLKPSRPDINDDY